MKLNSRDATAFFAKPDPGRAGILIYGADAMRVSLKREDMLANLLGPKAEEEMRLTRFMGGDLRRDGAGLQDAMRAVGFFPGQRAVLVEEAADGLADVMAAALDDWQPGDAMVVVTAGSLAARSKLRKVFESHSNALAAAIYDDPPGRAEIEAECARAGLRDIPREAMADLEALGRSLDPGDFRQTIEKIALYKLKDSTPLTSDEIAILAPATIEAELDELLNAVAEAQSDRIGPLMVRLDGQGVAPVTMCIMASRHFRTLHSATSDPGGPATGIARARPPVFGPRRDRMTRQAQDWGLPRLEAALASIYQTDLALRSAGQTAPQMALVERMFIRLAMLRGART